MNLEIERQAILLNGSITAGDSDKFRKALENNSEIRLIIFDNCLGGLVDEGVKIAELIRIAGISTVAKNQVSSSCAYAFLAGKTRRFDEGWGTHLVFLHASRNIDPANDVAPKINGLLIPYLEALTEGKMSQYVSSLTRKSVGGKEGVIFVRTNFLFLKREKTVYCNGHEEKGLSQCEDLVDADADKMGIINK